MESRATSLIFMNVQWKDSNVSILMFQLTVHLISSHYTTRRKTHTNATAASVCISVSVSVVHRLSLFKHNECCAIGKVYSSSFLIASVMASFIHIKTMQWVVQVPMAHYAWYDPIGRECKGVLSGKRLNGPKTIHKQRNTTIKLFLKLLNQAFTIHLLYLQSPQ